MQINFKNMNILVDTKNNLVKYADYDFTIKKDCTEVYKDGELKFVVGDLFEGNCEVRTTTKTKFPKDWTGNKYKNIDGGFVKNDEFIEDEQ